MRGFKSWRPIRFGRAFSCGRRFLNNKSGVAAAAAVRSAIASFISRDLPGVASFILNEFSSISRIFFNETLKKQKKKTRYYLAERVTVSRV